jgi:hypothetical protein
MQIVGITEIVSGSFVSIYNGKSNVSKSEGQITLIEARSAQYDQDTILSKDQILRITTLAATIEDTLYSEDMITLTSDQMKKTILPLCTDELSDRLIQEQFIEKYSQDFQDANAYLIRSPYSSMLAGITQDDNGGYSLPEFQLDNGSKAILCSDSWLGSLIADKDLDKAYGLKRCEIQNGQRIYTTYYFFELVEGEYYLADFITYETGMGEMTGTGNG